MLNTSLTQHPALRSDQDPLIPQVLIRRSDPIGSKWQSNHWIETVMIAVFNDIWGVDVPSATAARQAIVTDF
jgi:hypothetical protein